MLHQDRNNWEEEDLLMNRRMRMKPDITRVRVSLKPASPTENEVSLGRSDEKNEWLNTWESDLRCIQTRCISNRNWSQWRIIWINQGMKWIILDINTNDFISWNEPSQWTIPSVSIVCKRGLFEIVNEFTFVKALFFTTILCKQGLFDILISLVISLQYPSFT